jgi:hypothetical protein
LGTAWTCWVYKKHVRESKSVAACKAAGAAAGTDCKILPRLAVHQQGVIVSSCKEKAALGGVTET